VPSDEERAVPERWGGARRPRRRWRIVPKAADGEPSKLIAARLARSRH
jgi:hypothetical protein